jgi:transposase-like protein
VLRDLKRRGLKAPVVGVGDGALGFWAALGEVWPETHEQRDWCHKIANVLDKLPKRVQGRAKRLLREIMYADTRAHADAGIEAFAAEFSPKYDKAVDSLVKDRAVLLTIAKGRPCTLPSDASSRFTSKLHTANMPSCETPLNPTRPLARVTRRGSFHQ